MRIVELLKQMFNQNKVELTPEKFLELSRTMGPVFDTAVEQHGRLKCVADHSIYHNTRTVENLIDVLENGIKTTAGGPRLIEYPRWRIISVAFFSGVPQLNEGVSYFGRLVVATHTAALDRPVYFKPLNFGYARARIALVYDPRLIQMDDEFRMLISELVEGKISPEQKFNDLDKEIGRLTTKVITKHNIHPCVYLEECERYLIEGVGLSGIRLKALADTLSVTGSDDMEHIVFGYGKEDYVKPSDGFGVGLLGEDIERDPLANKLSRGNIPFRYLTIGKDDDTHYVENLRSGAIEPYTHKDFPRSN